VPDSGFFVKKKFAAKGQGRDIENPSKIKRPMTNYKKRNLPDNSWSCDDCSPIIKDLVFVLFPS